MSTPLGSIRHKIEIGLVPESLDSNNKNKKTGLLDNGRPLFIVFYHDSIRIDCTTISLRAAKWLYENYKSSHPNKKSIHILQTP